MGGEQLIAGRSPSHPREKPAQPVTLTLPPLIVEQPLLPRKLFSVRSIHGHASMMADAALSRGPAWATCYRGTSCRPNKEYACRERYRSLPYVLRFSDGKCLGDLPVASQSGPHPIGLGGDASALELLGAGDEDLDVLRPNVIRAVLLEESVVVDD